MSDYWDKRLGKGEWNRGSKKSFDSPEQLKKLAGEYFTWCEKNPIILNTPNNEPCKKTRVFTHKGLAIHLGVCGTTMDNYAKKEDFDFVLRQISEVIFEQKVTLAAAGEVNQMFIARELGLENKLKIDASLDVRDVTKMTNEELQKEKEDLDKKERENEFRATE